MLIVSGREIVPATYLSPFTLLCVAPEQPTGAGTVFIEVSNNAKDWTSQRTLFHFAPCPAGYYCPEGEPLPCPRGAFCGGGSGGAANFTLCPVGTFQPRTSQSSCLPAPIGFVAPDVGTSQPSVCPRGAVCDITGLTGTSKACPPGHYCLEGTRTSNFTDFGTPERPLPCPFGTYCGPGVTTNRTIANNFTTPQTCFAGYMCEPGSATPQGSGPCPSGHYCPPGELIPCPSRTYCPGVANTEPKPCIPGLYQQEPGQASCKKCPLGTICPGFARELPEPCPPGYVCDAEGLPIPAKRCPAGHYCLRNTLTPDPLSALDTDALLRASPVAISETQFRPLPCLPATYCMEGVENNVTNAGVFSQPQPCKEVRIGPFPNPKTVCPYNTDPFFYNRRVRTANGAPATTRSSSRGTFPPRCYRALPVTTAPKARTSRFPFREGTSRLAKETAPPRCACPACTPPTRYALRFPNRASLFCRLSARNYGILALRNTDTLFYPSQGVPNLLSLPRRVRVRGGRDVQAHCLP